MKEYKIKIDIKATKETAWNVLTDFESYPKWNSVLTLNNNDSLILGRKFDVTISQTNGKHSNFKATAISKKNFQSFSATQKIIGKWFFQATHYFIIKEIDKEHITFIQKWELQGVISSVFRKQIFKELKVFDKMNNELQLLVEK
ncbi:SRPBCC domain-containing protein [Maribacter forsetii]|uniref:SRPBCC domain-containing protein n=1 Tax=Maribacter forsetii TaxID=444515 RepID=UPI00055F6CFE|nr:SRPBCC domain-containing protein [Maribacter forsetii]